MPEPTHRFLDVNGIRLHIAEQGEGPLVVLCHGWPECWYSWRHQIPALAEAGYRVVAPDQRGYGESDCPPEVESYTQLHLVGDLVGLLDALGEETATVSCPIHHRWNPHRWNPTGRRPCRSSRHSPGAHDPSRLCHAVQSTE